jgi:hypothetical protein
MTKPQQFKKLRKFISNPNLFFYDMFRKRLFKDIPQATIKTASETTTIAAPAVDILEVRRVGVVEYIRKFLGAGVGPEDGYDSNSLLIWNGYLNGLISFVAGLKEAMSMDVTIYTLGGGYSLISKCDDKFDIKSVCKSLNSRPDFVVEMSNPLGELYVLHIYLFDINPEGLATVRSNRAWIRRFPLTDLEVIFKANTQKSVELTPIDAVYTWVNHADVDWQEHWQSTFPEEAFDPDRYTSNDELRYSLRSLNKYAPWLRKIYIVSNCRQPSWLDSFERIVWVKHEDIFPDHSALPTFNSHAIEACLHLIEGLSEQFIYLNDDFVLSQPCLPSDFFDEVGRSLAYFESYGMVDTSENREELPDYLIAAKNSKHLIKQEFLNYDARNLHRHVPYALKKSVISELETKFASAFELTRQAKRRSESDINLTSFLYHHYAYAKGLAVKGDALGLIVRPGNAGAVAGKDSYKYKILCFNDGNGSAEDSKYKAHTQAFFDKRLAERAPWEHQRQISN